MKVMIQVVENLLPEHYFTNNLMALSVDLAVFRELLRVHLPRLWAHVTKLQGELSSLTRWDHITKLQGELTSLNNKVGSHH